jgi:peptidoglycan/xylan/chitin deacetylase (PgdA/CDA1 family)
MIVVTVSAGQILRRIAFLALLIFLVALTTSVGGRALRTGAAPADEPLTHGNSADNLIALTFDITWGHEELAKIASTLDAHGVRGTFFVGGTFLAHSRERVKQLAVRGHEIGTLGQKIVDLSVLTEQEVATNLLASQSALSKALGGPVRYFRPPQGPATPEVVRGARTANLLTVTYSLDSEDHLGRSADQIARRVVRRASKNEIIRLSASDWSPETSKALPQIIKGLQERGFTLVTLSELVSQSPSQ